MRTIKKKDTFEALQSKAFHLRAELARLRDDTTNTKQELSVVLSSIDAFGTMVTVELNQSNDEFGVKPELWF